MTSDGGMPTQNICFKDYRLKATRIICELVKGFAFHGSVFLKICCLYMIDRILRLRRNFELESV